MTYPLVSCRLVEPDRVDRLVVDVVRLQPDINKGAKELGARLLHLSDLIQRHYVAVCNRFQITLTGHSVLTTLRRHHPRELTLVDINRDALVTSGGITFVIRRLEEQGRVQRRRHPDDARSLLIRLTPGGLRTANRVIAAMADADAAIAGALARGDRKALVMHLRNLEREVECVDKGTQTTREKRRIVRNQVG